MENLIMLHIRVNLWQFVTFAAVIALAIMAGSIFADDITVENHSFEDPDASAHGGFSPYYIAVPGWWHPGFSGTFDRIAAGYESRITETPDGTAQAAYANGSPSWPAGLVQNILSDTLQPLTRYTLMVDIGLPIGGELEPEPGYGHVYNGATIDLATTPDQSEVYYLTAETESLVAPEFGGWSTWEKTFVTGSSPERLGDYLRIELYVSNDPATTQILFDNVRLTTEPILPGDANLDGVVDADDAADLAANWLRTEDALWEHGDFNGDGNVDDIDATLLATNWSSGSAASVPEPGMFVILIGFLFSIAAFRQQSA